MLRRDRSDSGFTVVESLMAIVILAIVFVTLTTGLQLAMRHQSEHRFRQQAGTLALEEIEISRSLPWDALELASAPPAGTPHTDGVVVTGSDFDVASDETLVVGPGADGVPGGIEPVTSGVVLDDQTFDVNRYVTDAAPEVRRVIVEVRWESAGAMRSFSTTTQIARVGAP